MKTQFSKFKWFLLIFMGCAVIAFGQTHSKSYNESFSVNDEVTIDVNTSYTDVEFETWTRDEVAIEAVIEVEGVSEEEAEKYFKGWDFEAMGNSGKVSITAKSGPRFVVSGKATRTPGKEGNLFISGDTDFDFDFDHDFDFDFDFDMPEMEEIEPFVMALKGLEKLPPMPPINFDNFRNFSFDYEKYKEEGDEYLEEWKEEFTENFDKNFKANLEAWKKEVEEYKKNAEKYKSRMKIDRDKLQKMREKQREQASRVRESVRESMKAARKAWAKTRTRTKKDKDGNIFYFRGSAKDKNVKVKKTIKIKMPKDAKLKMNVRHGEVKLAENFKNIKATLSYTRLLAHRVDGAQTYIEASFSPIVVDHWNKGKLRVNYVKDVALKTVKSVDLSSKSSNVVIGNITEDALIKGSFNTLKIENVANNFRNLDMVLDNTDAVIVLPQSAFDFYCNASNSRVNFPEQLLVNITEKYAGQLAKGYHKKKNSNKNINLTTTYSEVIIR